MVMAQGTTIARLLDVKSLLVGGLGVVALSLAAACGGSVTGGGSEEDEPALPDPNDTPAKPSDQPSGKDNPNADTELGACKLGVSALGESAYPCPWVAGERCYTTREMACNCVCPRDRDSQCSSGFEAGPDGRVEVYCY
jgi:hypothetical protein